MPGKKDNPMWLFADDEAGRKLTGEKLGIAKENLVGFLIKDDALVDSRRNLMGSTDFNGHLIISAHSIYGGKNINLPKKAGEHAAKEDAYSGADFAAMLKAKIDPAKVKRIDLFVCITGKGSFGKDFAKAWGTKIPIYAANHFVTRAIGKIYLSKELLGATSIEDTREAAQETDFAITLNLGKFNAATYTKAMDVKGAFSKYA